MAQYGTSFSARLDPGKTGERVPMQPTVPIPAFMPDKNIYSAQADAARTMFQNLFNPATPQTHGEQFLQALDPGYWAGQGVRDVVGATQGFGDWWNQPLGGAQPETGPDLNGMLSQYLKGLQGLQGEQKQMPLPGGGSGLGSIQLPQAPHLQTPQFAATPSTPPSTPTPLDQATVPGALTPEEQQSLVSRGKWSGAAQAALQHADDGIGDLLLAAGLGGLAGENAAKDKALDVNRQQQRDQFTSDRETQRYNLDRQDRLDVANTEYQLKSMGMQNDQARILAETQNQQVRLQYDAALEQAKLQLSAVQQMQPKIQIIGKEGNEQVAIIVPGQPIQLRPLNSGEMSGLTGIGRSGDLQELLAAQGDPVMTAKALVHQVLKAGAGADVFTSEALGATEEEISSQVPADFRTTGVEGDKALHRLRDARLQWELTKAMLQPNVMIRALQLLTPKTAGRP